MATEKRPAAPLAPPAEASAEPATTYHVIPFTTADRPGAAPTLRATLGELLARKASR